MRFALNIASTRLILSHGHYGPGAAGKIIQAFGHFVMQGSILVGVTVFIILTIINLIVITKGSGRIAEVAARFSLDSMPGKQMAIDAELSAGIIDADIAKKKRTLLEQESKFFGAMDGASKFVKGDAVAGIVIILVNFIFGITNGMIKGMSASHAAHTYTILTIGDGLVSQIPALIVSIAAGLLITQSSTQGQAGNTILQQITGHNSTLIITAGALFLCGLLPGMPTLVLFFIVIGIVILIYFRMTSREPQEQTPSETANPGYNMDSIINTELTPISLELGVGLQTMLDPDYDILSRIQTIKNNITSELGFLVPSVKVKCNPSIDEFQYHIKIKDIVSGIGTIYPDKKMIIDTGIVNIHGITGIEPTYNSKAIWINEAQEQEAQDAGCSPMQHDIILMTHLNKIIRDNISELVNYTLVQLMIEQVKEKHAKLIIDLIPAEISIFVLEKIIRSLLSEGISIRDLPTIIASSADVHKNSPNIEHTISHVRKTLARQISNAHASSGTLNIISVNENTENEIANGIDDRGNINIPISTLQDLANKIVSAYHNATASGKDTVVLVRDDIRHHLHLVLSRFSSEIFVMAHSEVHQGTNVQIIAMI